MSDPYFLGGAPRVGKSTAATLLLNQHPMRIVSTDSLRLVIRAAAPTQKQDELSAIDNLFFTEKKYGLFQDTPEKAVELQMHESSLTWPYITPFIQHEIENRSTLLVEGMNVTPQNLKTLSYNHRAVFIGNQSDKHIEAMIKNTQTDPTDWMFRMKLEEKAIRAFATFLQEYRYQIQRDAEKLGYTYMEIDDDDFDGSLQKVISALIG